MVENLVSESNMPQEDEVMKDPFNDRVVNSVPRLPIKPLMIERVFPLDGKGNPQYAPETELIKNFQYNGGLLHKDAFMKICEKATAVLKKEPNVVRVQGKVVIVGDIHGQYYDLLNILRKAKFGRSNKKFVFR